MAEKTILSRIKEHRIARQVANAIKVAAPVAAVVVDPQAIVENYSPVKEAQANDGSFTPGISVEAISVDKYLKTPMFELSLGPVFEAQHLTNDPDNHTLKVDEFKVGFNAGLAARDIKLGTPHLVLDANLGYTLFALDKGLRRTDNTPVGGGVSLGSSDGIEHQIAGGLYLKLGDALNAKFGIAAVPGVEFEVVMPNEEGESHKPGRQNLTNIIDQEQNVRVYGRLGIEMRANLRDNDPESRNTYFKLQPFAFAGKYDGETSQLEGIAVGGGLELEYRSLGGIMVYGGFRGAALLDATHGDMEVGNAFDIRANAGFRARVARYLALELSVDLDYEQFSDVTFANGTKTDAQQDRFDHTYNFKLIIPLDGGSANEVPTEFHDPIPTPKKRSNPGSPPGVAHINLTPGTDQYKRELVSGGTNLYK